MAEHLAGCAGCWQVAEFCEKLARVAMAMRLQQTPEAVVRRARAICPARAEGMEEVRAHSEF
jgi:hypothetical protein